MKKGHGFTLIELLVAISIMAILAALAIPSYLDLIEKGRLRGAAEAVYEQLQYARSESLKRSVPMIVDFSIDATDATIWVLGITDDFECWALANPSACTTWGCSAAVTSATTANACVVEYDNDMLVDYDSDGSNADPILMRLTSTDHLNVTMKGSTNNSPSFGAATGPGACATTTATQACFEPLQGLARATLATDYIQLESDNYNLQVRVDEVGRVTICVPIGAKYFAGYAICPS